jgi:hypothetical protein
LIFKYFLLFDFILGEKIPIEIAQKWYNNLTNKKSLYNVNINRKDYIMFKNIKSKIMKVIQNFM